MIAQPNLYSVLTMPRRAILAAVQVVVNSLLHHGVRNMKVFSQCSDQYRPTWTVCNGTTNGGHKFFCPNERLTSICSNRLSFPDEVVAVFVSCHIALDSDQTHFKIGRNLTNTFPDLIATTMLSFVS